jgi:hypothetical protein
LQIPFPSSVHEILLRQRQALGRRRLANHPIRFNSLHSIHS